MNMDYSKAFELLNQDTKKEHNEKAEKAVHDKFYNKGFRDGIAVLDKIRAEIEEQKENRCFDYMFAYIITGLDDALEIIDEYKAESEDKE